MNDALVGGLVVVTFVLPTVLFGAVFVGIGVLTVLVGVGAFVAVVVWVLR